MQTLEFWKTVTMDRSNFLEGLISLLRENGIRYCLIGGQAVNAYVEPVVSLDLDIVVAAGYLDKVEELLDESFKIEHFPNSVKVSRADSNLRVQFQTDPRYADFVSRATPKTILGITLPVAALEDLLQDKVWAAMDPTRRVSKRQKDLADIARLLEEFPELKDRVPQGLLQKLMS